MIESLILCALILMLIAGTIASNGWDQFELRNREVWWWTCILMIEAILIWPVNRFACALLAMNILGLWQIGRAWYVLRMTVIPIAGLGASYALIVPHMQRWMVPYVLTTGVAIGLFLSAWTVVALIITQRPFRLMAPLPKWCGMWGIYEDAPFGWRHLCGQAHMCHLTSLVALSMSCGAGLIYLGYSLWAIPATMICYLPAHVVWARDGKAGHPHVGHLGLIGAGIAALALWDANVAGLTLTGGLIAGAAIVWRSQGWRKNDQSWWDSGRLAYWRDVLRMVYWHGGWQRRLFGYGTSTWFAVTYLIGEKLHAEIYTSAHNEYLQQLIEHGALGLIVMLTYLIDGFYRNLIGTPEQQAIVFLIATWCAIACVHFPAVFYHSYTSAEDKQLGKEHWYGSPPMNVWTFVIALLAEVK